MFLPVLLIRDFGPWSFAVFAVPNVVGAALMGWVLRKPGSAAALVDQHRHAVALFSVVTTLFQVFFYGWLLWALSGGTAQGPAAGGRVWVLLPLLLVIVAVKVIRPMQLGAALVWLVSLGLLGWLGLNGHLGLPASIEPVLSEKELLWLAPVCAFGFALCPYLDATFLLASASQDGRGGTRSFAIGFGAIFCSMIVGTLLYANLLDVRSGVMQLADPRSIAAGVLGLHILLQLTVTIMYHIKACPRPKSGPNAGRASVVLFAAAIVAVLFLPVWKHLVADLVVDPSGPRGLAFDEVVYRSFMAFYGLVFPAYVWLCMIPNWKRSEPTRQQVTVWLAACVIATPAYWMGFIERQTWWLGPGLAVVFLARLLIQVQKTNHATGRVDPAPGVP